MIRNLILLAFYLAYSVSFSQTVKKQTTIIEGKEPDYKGMTLRLLSFSDYITKKEIELAACKVDSLGNFRFSFSQEQSMQTFIKLGALKGIFYPEPGNTYFVKFPPRADKTKAEELNPFFTEDEFYIGCTNHSKDELTYNIGFFTQKYNEYLELKYLEIIKKGHHYDIEKDIRKFDSIFPTTKPFFKVYKNYRYAELRNLSTNRENSESLQKQIVHKPIYTTNPAYMDFFNKVCYNYFLQLSKNSQDENIAIHIGMQASISKLRNDIVLLEGNIGDTLTEMAIMKGIYDAFYEKSYPLKSLFSILDSMQNSTQLEMIREMSKNMKSKFTQMLEGFAAPNFELPDKKDNLYDLASFKGKYVYLNFCTRESYTCLEHFELIKKIHSEMNNHLEVVSICIDENFEATLSLAQQMGYKWLFLNASKNTTVIHDYLVKAYPTYFLIDPEGFLVFSPAPSPIEDFGQKYNQAVLERKISQLRKNKDEKE